MILKEEEISLATIEIFPPEKIQDYDLICFGFPVYACNSPSYVREYIKKLPSVKNKGLFLFCTKGLSAGNAIYRTYKKFKKKGYNYLGHSSIIMPGSDGLMMFSKDSKYIQKLNIKDFDHIKKTDKFIDLINGCINLIKSGKEVSFFKKRSPIDLLISPLDLILSIVYNSFAKSLKKKLWADENCSRCNTCVKICPVSNITLESDGIHFSNKCFLCMRCINQCPQEAIQFGKHTKGKFRWKGPKKGFKPLKILNAELTI